MNIILWIVASVLAAAFLAGGAMKLVQPKEKLAASGFGFVENFGRGAVKAIGLVEIAAGVGLVLPAAIGVAPILVPLAAVGVVLLMIGAVVVHARRDEARSIVVNVALILLAGFVAWGRFGPESFSG